MSNDISIQKMSELLNISKSALRYYEKKDLVSPKRGETSNYRKYSFDSLIELSEIILYRKMDISMNQLYGMLQGTVETEEDIIESSIFNAEKELNRYMEILGNLQSYRQRFLKYRRLKDTPYRVVNGTTIERAVEFSFLEKKRMNRYVESPNQYAFVVVFDNPLDPNSVKNGIIELKPEGDEKVIWSPEDNKGQFLECLLKSEYAYARKGNLQEHLDYMKENNMKPGKVLGEYLFPACDKKTKERCDYYKLWIHIE